jgi:hypothetical protein
MPLSKTHLRPEIKEAILTNQVIRERFRDEFTKTDKTIQNWVSKDDLMLTTELSLSILTDCTGIEKEFLFRVE